jgi:hypothetical protein
MELAEHQREQRELRESISDVCYGCVVCRAIGEVALSLRRSLSEAGGDDTRRVPDDVDHHAAGDHACAYHFPEIEDRRDSTDKRSESDWPSDEAGPFGGDD